ncbi:hypothetical protein [Streptomyces tailanensis]|uniref:hypothetical protein n=1 Tax=Streptomyces tailanensis TaxID=2569858 RepID=UPI00122E4807|nr:hypothetical protein [Streptomyces tailanensis]
MRRLINQLACGKRLFFMPTGRYREDPLSSLHQSSGSFIFRTALAPTVRHWYEPFDGTSQALAHLCLAAYEYEEKTRIQPLRRDIHAHLGAAS